MIMEEKKVEKTVIAVSEYGRDVTWTDNTMDVDTTRLVEAFYGLLVSLGYHPYSVLNSMKELAYENDKLLSSFEKSPNHDLD